MKIIEREEFDQLEGFLFSTKAKSEKILALINLKIGEALVFDKRETGTSPYAGKSGLYGLIHNAKRTINKCNGENITFKAKHLVDGGVAIIKLENNND